MNYISKLKYKFIALFCFIIFAWIAIVFVSYRYISTNIIEKNAQTLFDETLSQMSHRIDYEIASYQNIVSDIKGKYGIKAALKNLEPSETNYFMQKSKITREIINTENFNIADNIYIFTKDFSPINAYYSEACFETPPEYEILLAQYNDILGDNNSIETKIRNGICHVVIKSYITERSKVLGLLVIEFNINNIDTIISSDMQGENEIYLLDSSNMILYANKQDTIFSSLYNYYSEDDNLTSYPINYNDWTLAGKLSDKIVHEEMSRLKDILIIFTVITLAIMLVLPITLEVSFYRQLNKILIGMDYIQKGDLNFVIENNAKNEFKYIIDNFNHMVRQIKELIVTTSEQQKLYHRAEMDALQAKLNPHFLYNTLDMVHWKLIMEDKPEISAIIVTLSDILRYAVSHSKEFVSVEEDMNNLEKYLSIQKLRFNNHLYYEINIEDQLKDFKIPKLFIQPLAENAIKHAFKGMSMTGRLNIDIFSRESDIVFRIADDGVGIPVKKLQSIQSSIKYGRYSNRLGLQLTYRRIFDLYPDTEIDIKSAEGKGTIIEIIIAGGGSEC